MIQEFKARVAADGLARSSKWIVQVHPPRGLTASGKALGGLLGGTFDINLPIFDAIDNAVGALNDIDINLGGVNVNFNPNIPTLGFSLSGENESLRRINMFTSDVTLPSRDVAEVIKSSTKKEIDRRDIQVPDIHTLGSYTVQIKLHKEVNAEINIEVTS